MRFRHVVTALCAIVLAASVGTSPAAAAAPPPGSVGALVWEDVQVTINRASLFQCPATNCNQGEASPPDDLQLWCKLAEGTRWYLVQNMSNGHVGWIDWSWLRARGTNELPTPPPNCLGTGIGDHVVVATTLYQCPGTNCNRGQAAPSDNIAVLCQLLGTGWRFVVNQTNAHVGLIQRSYLDWDPNVELC
jgi:hypothetical protein